MVRFSSLARWALAVALLFGLFAAAFPRGAAARQAESFPLTGIGIRIFSIEKAEGGDPQAIARVAHEAGFSFVMLKLAHKTIPASVDAKGADLLSPVVEALRAMNVSVWGWVYVTGSDPAAEARIAAERMKELKLDGLVVEADVDYEQYNRDQDAAEYMEKLRDALPGVPIGLNSFRYPSKHKGFPWEAFLKRVDFVMPQVYWEEQHNPAEQLDLTIEDYARLTTLPLVPEAPNYEVPGWKPTPEDMVQFREAVQEHGLPAMSFSSWDYASQVPDLWAVITNHARLPSPTPTATPPSAEASCSYHPLSVTLKGTGIFVAKLAQAEGGDALRIANAARDAGLSFVAIKVADGVQPENSELSAQNQEVIRALRNVGVQVWGWQSVHGTDPAGEAQVAITRLEALSLDGYIVQVTPQPKETIAAQSALTFMQILRTRFVNLPVAFASYGTPSFYPDLPWNEFLCYADIALPQVFWVNAQTPDNLLTGVVKEYQSLKNVRPIVPIGPAYQNGSWLPTAAEIALFRDKARALQLPAIAFWEWSQARSLTGIWEAISGAASQPIYVLPATNAPASTDVRSIESVDLGDTIPRLMVTSGQGTSLFDGRSSLVLDSRPAWDALQTRPGVFFLATAEGIARVVYAVTSGSSNPPTPQPDIIDNFPATTLAVSEDRVWAGGKDGVRAFDLESGRLVTTYLTDTLGIGGVQALAAERGSLWVGGENGLLQIVEDHFQIFPLPAPITGVTALAVAPNGAVWLGAHNGAARWDGEGWQVFTPANGLASPFIRAIDFDVAGGVWFATPNGAIRYDTGQQLWQRYFRQATAALTSDNILALCVDPAGTVWLGTEAGTTSLVGRSAKAYVNHYDGQAPGSQQTNLLARDGDGNLWVGSYDAGVSVLSGDLSDRGNTSWLVFDQNTSLLPDNEVTAMAVDDQNQVWVGTSRGLGICTLAGCQAPENLAAQSVGAVETLAKDSRGAIWVASATGLLRCASASDCQPVPQGPSGGIVTLTPTADGSLWVSTRSQGVFVCREPGCDLNPAATPPNADQTLPTPRLLVPLDSSSVLVYLPTGQPLECASDTCQVSDSATPITTTVVAAARDTQGRLWELHDPGELTVCQNGDCQIAKDISSLSAPARLVAGTDGDMWIFSPGQATYFYCSLQSSPDCKEGSLNNDGSLQDVLPLKKSQAWFADLLNGVFYCSSLTSCTAFPPTAQSFPAFAPPAGRPWLRFTANTSLPPDGGKLLDTQSALVEFEGGSLTSAALDLSYEAILSDTITQRVVYSKTIARNELGVGSPGQVNLGQEQPLAYGSYRFRLIVSDPSGQQATLTRRFQVQANPKITALKIGGQDVGAYLPETKGGVPRPVNLRVASTYALVLSIGDPDSINGPFTLRARWVVSGTPGAPSPWRILQLDSSLPADKTWRGELAAAADPSSVTALEIEVQDSDGNLAPNGFFPVMITTPLVSRPWWADTSLFIIGLLSTVLLGFVALAYNSRLPLPVFLRQGVSAISVGLNYRRYRALWQARPPWERLLLLLFSPGQPATLPAIHEQLTDLDIPATHAEVEHRLESLVSGHLLERTAQGYCPLEPVLLRALQAHEGTAGRAALARQVRSEHPLFSDALHFFTEAGFACKPYETSMAFACIPQTPTWQKTFPQPVYARVLPGEEIDHKNIIAVQQEARADPACSNQVIFVIVDRTPSDSAWLQIGTLRTENVQIIPIDDALIQGGRQQQKERETLAAHLRRYLGKRRDLYNVRDPVADRLNFFGREAQAHELLQILSEGRPVALFGLRKMGKSSLLQFMRDRASFPVASIDLQAGIDLPDLYTRILEAWQRSLRVKCPEVNWEALRFAETPSTGFSLLSAAFAGATRDLIAKLEAAGQPPLLGLFIDEIEVIVPREPEGVPVADQQVLDQYLAFVRTLRGLAQETRSLALLVVGVDPKLNRVNRWGAEQNPLYQFFREEYLGPLDREDCIQMVRNIGQQMGLAYTDDAVQYVAQVSGGHPFQARQLCSAAIQELGDSLTGPVTLEQMQAAAERFVRDPSTEALLSGLWGEVTNPELWPQQQVIENQDILTTLAKEEQQPEAVVVAAGKDRAARERSVFELRQRSVLNKLQDALRIQFGLFRTWIRKYKT